jgi:inorganic pyrophosphatase
MDINKLSIGRNAPNEVNVVIEIPQGGIPVKYELDKESGAMLVDRFLHTAMYYPGRYQWCRAQSLPAVQSVR